MFGMKFLVKIILPALIIFMLTSSGFAQEDLKEIINNIEGHVDKITISAGGEEFTFEGEDAEKLFEKMKADRKSVNTFVIKMDDKDSKGTKKIIIKSDGGDEEIIELETSGGDHAVWFSDDKSFDKLEKNIKVEIEDGKKKVTVTTTENGEEKTEVYEGDEADKFLENMKSENGNDFMIITDEKGNHKKIEVIIEEEDIKEDNK